MNTRAFSSIARTVVTQTTSTDFRWAAMFVLFVVLEGVPGKWLSPALEYPPVLLRDLLALWIVWRAWRSGRMRQHPQLFALLSIWSVVIIIFAFLQTLVLQQSLPLLAIGLRFWVMYLWVALALCSTLTWVDFQRLCRLLVAVLWLMLPLLLVQNAAGADSFINRGFAEEGTVFVISGDIVRASSTFSFTFGFACFLLLATPLLLSGAEVLPNELRRWYVRPAQCFALLVACVVVSGGRGVMVVAASMTAVAVLANLIFGGRRVGSILTGALLGGVVLAAMLEVNPETFEAIDQRVTSAHAVEDPVQRILQTFLGSSAAWDNFTLLGEGLGLASNMSARLAGAAPGDFMLAEVEVERVLLAGGLVGLLWLLLKLVMLLAGLAYAVAQGLKTRRSLPLMLWSASAVALLTWPMSGQMAAQALGTLLLALAGMSVGCIDRTRY